MSLRYRSASGVETVLAGLTPGGDLAFGATTTRSGHVDLTNMALNTLYEISIVFDEPLNDADYEVVFSGYGVNPTPGSAPRVQCVASNKTKNGFSLGATVTSGTSGPYNASIHWKAFKLYEVEHAAQNAEDINNIKAVIPSTASSSNKLATSNDVSSLATSTDSRLDNLEDVVPTGASVSNQLATKSYVDTEVAAKQDPLTFDTVPTAGSGNPVTSDGIKTALDNKQTALTFDSTPTAGSENPVTSGGVKAAIDAIPSNPVDSIINNDLHAITSNAIFDMLNIRFRPVYQGDIYTDTSIDLNNCTTPGFANFLVSPNNPNNGPRIYAYLLVLRYGGTNITQVLIPYYHSSDALKACVIAIRGRFQGSWGPWCKVAGTLIS